MPAKRSLWAKPIINSNYLINTIHKWASRVFPPARVSGRPVEKRYSANLSFGAIYGLPNQPKFLGIQRGIKTFYPKIFWPGHVKSVG
jgi:hypothetical protein